MNPEDVQRDWAERAGKYSPRYYAELGPNKVTETLREVFDHYVPSDAAILELGCSSGRHLAALYADDYENVTGIDVNDEAFDVMADHYPKLAEAGTFHVGAIEDFLPEMDDDAFDVVYSVETLQHIHPDNEWVFDEIVRVTSDLLITAENEGNSPTRGREDGEVSYVDDEFPLYHRNWKRVFTDRGLAQLLCEPGNRDTVRVFRVV